MSLRNYLPKEATITMTAKDYELFVAEIYQRGRSLERLIAKDKIEKIFEALHDKSAFLIADGDMGSDQLVFIESIKEAIAAYLERLENDK